MGTVLIGREAMLAAGTAGPWSMPEQPDHTDVSALLDKLPGLDRKRVLAKLRELTDATKTVTASFMGKITDSIEVADNPTQLAATRLALEMHRLVGQDGARVSVGTVNILWQGGSPQWAKPATERLVNTSVTNSVPNGNAAESVPISTVEGTGPGPAPSTHEHSATPANEGVLTQRVKAARTVKKRRPRLPVYKP